MDGERLGTGAGGQASSDCSLGPRPSRFSAPAYSGTVVLNRGQFYPAGNILQCLETFLVVTTWAGGGGRIRYWHLVGRGRDTAKHPLTHRSVGPHDKELSTPHVSSAKVEKPRLREQPPHSVSSAVTQPSFRPVTPNFQAGRLGTLIPTSAPLLRLFPLLGHPPCCPPLI